jgi:hypothetical protein
MVQKVISGGQTGADQAGLFAAEACGIETGGWMPRDFLTLAGNRPEFEKRFKIISTLNPGYPVRTGLNVRDACGTIRVASRWMSAGQRCTLNAIREHRKPYIDVDMPPNREVDEAEVNRVVAWIRANQIKTLNVAGNSEPASLQSRSSGITAFTQIFLMKVFAKLKEGQTSQE